MSQHTPRPKRSRRGRSLAVGLLAATGLTGVLPVLPSTPASAAGETAMVYKVTAEGLTPEASEAFAKEAGVGNALRPDGSFAYTDRLYARVPQTKGETSVDESKRKTVAQHLNTKSLDRFRPMPRGEALEKANAIVDLPKGYDAKPLIGHTLAEVVDAKGETIMERKLDTTISYRLMLDGKPVIGPGAKAKAAFRQSGRVMLLNKAVREVEPAGRVPIISADEAKEQCATLYGKGVRQRTPMLSYYAPALDAREANGKGIVELVLPQYICQPSSTAGDEVSRFTGRMVPAAPRFSPQLTVEASTDGKEVVGTASVKGGSGPYTIQWSSSSAILGDSTGAKVSYAQNPRGGAQEILSAVVTDANGQTAVAHVALGDKPGTPASGKAEGLLGGQGGSFATAGIEQTVDEWQCAQDSANGFKSVLQSQGDTVKFDWRGNNAWEQDFKAVAAGGDDSDWIDDVDIAWYTGHGSPNSFTFKTNNDDKNLTPADADWGDKQLEWLQLESCQVLRDTNGTNDYFDRWGPTMDGLHLLNGFHTNAYCIGGGTGERFAEYLFPEKFLWWTTRPALTVQQAWARMADDLEPAGVRWRSMSPIGPGGVTNINDYFWGEGTVGPDIRLADRVGMIAISGVS